MFRETCFMADGLCGEPKRVDGIVAPHSVFRHHLTRQRFVYFFTMSGRPFEHSGCQKDAAVGRPGRPDFG
jgi:hypothetical protein